ncbi:MAG: hypothetical protein CFH06_00113 [Alphaproteobacteria bacterium MarineAlpha3_Bin5]|nr:hypothetical protein [Magnetovibrio sp.]PPR80110.1 MAG: hypothetical protein CFH06_00113 [Alphaproteobacteria bacterium MarineAlpha3_Bin5]
MSKNAKQVLILLCTIVLANCESAKKIIGNKKQVPDEFVIYARPPLSLPPNFGLRPPSPGSSTGLAVTPGMEAAAALSGRKAQINTPADAGLKDTPGTFAILKQTGALDAHPSIRKVINQETSILSKEDTHFVNKLIFWVDDKPYEGTVVDADKESKRIQENQALGKTLDQGETPKIKRKQAKKGLLEF